MPAESVGCETWQAEAARAKCFSLASATKYSSLRTIIIASILYRRGLIERNGMRLRCVGDRRGTKSRAPPIAPWLSIVVGHVGLSKFPRICLMTSPLRKAHNRPQRPKTGNLSRARHLSVVDNSPRIRIELLC